ncbi:tripartite tricarboxylate transporter permease [Sneathiella sp.]|uniref:tripartite tricarboxylate transporter permease n=1 Tax=Sneathiella sp. TaxID=1964365 RepID=UPI003563C8DC
MLIEGLIGGLDLLIQPSVLLALFVGVTIGMAFGVTPGLDATSGTALLVSATYALSTEVALAVLIGLYTAATYAGSITAITIGVPGTPASAATVLDGYELTKKGELDSALSISITASVIGGLIGTVALVFLALPLADLALAFGAPEYFALGVLGVAIIASLVKGSILSGFVVALFGLILTTVGIDPLTGFPRFTFNNINLIEGIPYIPALVGLFAVSEALSLLFDDNGDGRVVAKPKLFAFTLSAKVFRHIFRVTMIGSVLGSFLGALPAVGAAAANWIGYNEAKRFSHNPERFGKGSYEGLAAAESSNNATVSSALVPLLALGIPGSATAAVLLGAMLLHGVTPGPSLFTQQLDLVYFIFLALGGANVFMAIFGVFGVGFWVKMVQMPKPFIVVTILTLSVVGSFSVRSNVFDIYLALGLGLFGYVLRRVGISVVPIVLAIVLGGLIEENLRRALIASNDGISLFLDRPIALGVLIFACLTFIIPFVQNFRSSDLDHFHDNTKEQE